MGIHGVGAFRPLAVGHGLEQRRHRRTQQLGQMRAGLEPADLAPYRLAPALADLLADQPLQDAVDLDAGRVGRCYHVGVRFADDEAVVDRQPQADVMHRRAGRQLASEPVALRERLGVDQPRLDLPQPVLPQIAVAFHGAAMHQTAGFFLRVACRRRHVTDSD